MNRKLFVIWLLFPLWAVADNHLSLGIGHQNSLLDFQYIVHTDSLTSLQTNLLHNGRWGISTFSDSRASIGVNHIYKPLHEFYATAEARHTYYTRYGCYFDEAVEDYTVSSVKEMVHWDDIQHQWEAEAHLGFRSAASGKPSPLTYMAEVDYYALHLPQVVTEHQTRAHARLRYDWGDKHALGCNLTWQSDFYVFEREYMPRDWWNYRHNFRSEPYYEYHGSRVTLHMGVHLDANFGRNNSPTLHTSQQTDLGVFCPSPNITMRAKLLPEWLDLHAEVTGRAGWGSLQNYMRGNPYYEIVPGVKSHHVPTYVPVNASLGFTLTPAKGLSVDLTGGYQYIIGDGIFEGYSYAYDYGSVYPWIVRPGYFNNYCIDIDQWRIQARLEYKYADKLELRAEGSYYFWHQYTFEDADPFDNVSGSFSSTYTPGTIYDRPNWEAACSIRWNVIPRWTLYSNNVFKGKWIAWIQSEDKTIRATIDLNLGTEIQAAKQVKVFAELRNLLNRKHYVFYGYQTQQINCICGVKINFK